MPRISLAFSVIMCLLLVGCASRVSEPLPAESTFEVLASGTFAGADALHDGAGRATIYRSPTGQRILRFTDFRVTPGPDLKVWLVAQPAVASSSDVSGSETFDLGDLKGTIGDQNYVIPNEVDLNRYRTIVIWCEAFGVLFASASAGPAG